MKKEKGITLVSLVVTIIILIILAGVSINLILGKNGIITIAKQAKENIELAQVKEQEQLNVLYSQMSGTSDDSTSYDEIQKLVEFKRTVATAITDMGVLTSEEDSADTMASNIRSISKTTTAEAISYDNSNSSLEATTMQSAIDELDSNLNDIIIVTGIVPNVTINAKSYKMISLSDILSIPDGYTIVASHLTVHDGAIVGTIRYNSELYLWNLHSASNITSTNTTLTLTLKKNNN